MLHEWGLKRWRRDSGDGDKMSWRQALTSARDCAYPGIESEWLLITNNGISVVAAVCVRDHWEEMSCDERRWCTNTLADEVGRTATTGEPYRLLDGTPRGIKHHSRPRPSKDTRARSGQPGDLMGRGPIAHACVPLCIPRRRGRGGRLSGAGPPRSDAALRGDGGHAPKPSGGG